MATYLFLSDEWLDEARTIRSEYEGRTGSIDHSVRMNLVVIEVPFGEGAVHAHVDTSTGELVLDIGHIEPVDLKVTIGSTSPGPSWSRAIPRPVSRPSCRARSRSRGTSPS
jgi:hypothetical protein